MPIPKPSVEPEIKAAALTITGPVREDNQDAVLAADCALPGTSGYLYAVADGMGGYAHGGMASALAVETIDQTIRETPHERPGKALRQGMDNANLNVFKAAQNLSAGRMGTTMTAAYILGDQLFLAHIGDSRAYLVRDGRAVCLTDDHTVVGDLVRSRLVSPEKVRTHAQRSILTRAVGLGLFIQPDIQQIKLKPHDRLILCSDGVWSAIQDDDFSAIYQYVTSAEEASQALIHLALERATDDNCSVVAVHLHAFHQVQPPPDNPATERRNGKGLMGWIANQFTR